MKVSVCLLLLLPLVFADHVLPISEETGRVYYEEENDPNYKRFIPMENENGEIEIVDLLAGGDPGIEPVVSASAVEFDLYTRNNRLIATTITNANVNTLRGSNFDPSKLSVFVAHGWTNSRSSEINLLIRSGMWASNNDVNLFIVDWSRRSRLDYLTAKNSVVGVGTIIGNFINSIQSTYGLSGSDFVLIGHSLGAHVMGAAGATVRDKVDLIIGLDPAGPLFSLLNTAERLDRSDAKVVEVMHTNGALLGMASSIGHVDYHPNGGLTQSGCIADVTGYCSHMRSYKFLAEALERGDVFLARKCSTYSAYSLGLCRSNERSAMGRLRGSGSTDGDYYLDTRAISPYGQS